MCDLTCISIMVVSKWLHEACRILLIIFKDSWNLEVRPGDTTSKECEYGLFIVFLQNLCSVMYECTKSFNQLEALFLNYRTDQEYLRAIKNIEGCPEVSHSWWFVNSTSYFMTPSFLRRVKDRRQDKLPPTAGRRVTVGYFQWNKMSWGKPRLSFCFPHASGSLCSLLSAVCISF